MGKHDDGREKIEAFGWECTEVNGHDAGAIHHSVANRKGGRPFMLIGNTVKGRGVSFMENQPIWHYRSPNRTTPWKTWPWLVPSPT